MLLTMRRLPHGIVLVSDVGLRVRNALNTVQGVVGDVGVLVVVLRPNNDIERVFEADIPFEGLVAVLVVFIIAVHA